MGILDVDICGPSVPKILGVEGAEVEQTYGRVGPGMAGVVSTVVTELLYQLGLHDLALGWAHTWHCHVFCHGHPSLCARSGFRVRSFACSRSSGCTHLRLFARFGS